MRNFILAMALLGGSVSAHAAVITGEISGTVTSSFATFFTAPGAKQDIKVGDTITARFSYATPEAADGSLSKTAGNFLATLMTDQISFDLAGHRWTSRGDFLAGLVPLNFGPADDPLRNFYLTTDDAPGAGDLRVKGYGFEIGDFGYELYQGQGYAGSFDRNSLKLSDGGKLLGTQVQAPAAVGPVPEPASWALMIGGLGLVGAALRTGRKTRVTAAFA